MIKRFEKGQIATIACLLLTGAYLAGYASPSAGYVAAVITHVVAGFLGIVLWLRWILRPATEPASVGTFGRLLVSLAAVTGGVLLFTGNTSAFRLLRDVHVVASLALVVGLLWRLARRGAAPTSRALRLLTVAGLLSGIIYVVHQIPNASDTVTNTGLPPADLAGDAMGGEGGPFFPSSVETASGGLIPESFFLDSEACGRCHGDVFEEWKSSAHHLSSFNNQWYRKSIEHMQGVTSTKPAQWCAGCHDPALLFSGQMDQPVEAFVGSEAANAGLACVACHSITAIKSTRGNAGYEITYPAMHELSSSRNPVLQKIHDVILHIDPGPHRSAFMQPFHTEQSAEFCQTCHKVHLDQAVNEYRWIRGFNTYDNWQASGVSGEGARSFYAPAEPLDCADCHMKQVPSEDEGHVDGFVSSHRFAAANTALPTAYSDTTQLNEVRSFLQNGALSVDLFGLLTPPINVGDESSQDGVDQSTEGGPGRAATGFAVGEESSAFGANVSYRDTLALIGPFVKGQATTVAAGADYRVEVVTRSQIVGHFFPTGTVDAQEAWLEFKVTDSASNILFWSGFMDETGQVDPSAHFFKAVAVDKSGNLIDKRNAFEMRSAVYVNLIPPGAADVAHYRLPIPEDMEGPLTIVARLNYRKFTDAYTRFSYSGDLSDISGPMKAVPVVPVVVMATDTAFVSITPGAAASADDVVLQNGWVRWTDYGIALLAEGDLRGAERAFRRAASADEAHPDSWVNLARVFVADDRLDEAAEVLSRALEIAPGFHKALFFRAMYYRSLGQYDKAIADLDAVAARFPKDRVVLNQRARMLFLDENLADAAHGFESVLRIDSEDLMAHYNLMLVYRAAGDSARAREHEVRYRRFRDDETAQELARGYRQRHPHVNNEAQPIHEHTSWY